MSDFKGFDDWLAVFRGGIQTDSKGQQHDGDKLIRDAVSTFDPQQHKPPVVIGHPLSNSPAFGYVDALKNVGSTLFAKIKDVVPAFEKLVKEGMYKKRSASFYPDGRLKHVGFLGAMPPAVKGLADMKFVDGEGAVDFEFSEPKFCETYGEAFEFICKQNRELSDRYGMADMAAGNILDQKTREFLVKQPRSYQTYEEAFRHVCEQENELTEVYYKGDMESGNALHKKTMDFLMKPQ